MSPKITRSKAKKNAEKVELNSDILKTKPIGSSLATIAKKSSACSKTHWSTRLFNELSSIKDENKKLVEEKVELGKQIADLKVELNDCKLLIELLSAKVTIIPNVQFYQVIILNFRQGK